MDYSNQWVRPAANLAGGAHTPHFKNTAELSTEIMPSPNKIFLPMQQHIGAPCEPVVAVGDIVKVGQIIGNSDKPVSVPIHSGVSGVVSEITSYKLTNGQSCKCVVIQSDGKDEIHESVKPRKVETPEDLVAAARDCGLVGLGGAGFPAHIKLSPKSETKIDTLIINAAECEPYITSDYRECIESTDDILNGLYLIKKILNIDNVIIGVEDNKPKAIEEMLRIATDSKDIDDTVKVMKLKSRYPQGAEKVLIYTATGRKLPLGKLPADVGCIVMNVTSVAVLYRFISTGMPLIRKRITVDGSAIANPKNLSVVIGTPINDVIDYCGGFKAEPGKILYGGPMMGICVADTSAPVLKQNNAILA
ncbi:MAG: RnfABCDGE type electron transport complex subunit C, partial [Clostridia bacterium]|nr:RnfABCDGE type electron transport complex subunit C [Clostridia bacterium]